MRTVDQILQAVRQRRDVGPGTPRDLPPGVVPAPEATNLKTCTVSASIQVGLFL